MNMSKATVSRMILNVVIDGIIGAIPFVGDLFDVFWRSNQRNAKLFEKELENPKAQNKRSILWLIFVILILVLLFYVCVVLPIQFLVQA